MDTEQDLHQAKILLVDDEPMIIELLEDVLSSAGFASIRGTTDVHQVVSLYAEWQPDLVILDIHMRSLDGFRCLAPVFLRIP